MIARKYNRLFSRPSRQWDVLHSVLLYSLLLSATVAYSAEVSRIGSDKDGTVHFKISGELQKGDTEKFLTITDGTASAIVAFESDGGDLQTGLDIGSLIRMRGYSTAVLDGEACYSACALAWLGGTSRIVGTDGRVSFHAAYVLENGTARESGVGNALVGAYLSKLGLKEDAVVFLTSAPPDDLNDLDADLSASLGIAVDFTSTQGKFGRLTDFETEDNEEREELTWAQLTQEQVSFILTSAESGNPKNQFNAGILYLSGLNAHVEKNAQKAVYWLTKAAEQGEARAQYTLYHVYSEGDGVAQDEFLAGNFLIKASEAGLKEADTELARVYMFGGVFPPDDTKANVYLRKLVEAGDEWAEFNLGVQMEFGYGLDADEKGAVELYRRSAESGFAPAQYRLGLAYMNARGVPIDYSEAARWMTLAAEADNADAQYSLAWMYAEGQGVTKDLEASAKWMSAAAVNGDAMANYWVAKNFSEGKGVLKDDYNAANFILKFLQSKSYRSRNDETASEVVNAYYGDWTPGTIAALQEALKDQGYYKASVDGTWGPSTAAAVEAFYQVESK